MAFVKVIGDVKYSLFLDASLFYNLNISGFQKLKGSRIASQMGRPK